MKLREFINHLEKISNNGKNDSMEVLIWDGDSTLENEFRTNNLCDEVGCPRVNRFEVENEMYDYVEIGPKLL